MKPPHDPFFVAALFVAMLVVTTTASGQDKAIKPLDSPKLLKLCLRISSIDHSAPGWWAQPTLQNCLESCDRMRIPPVRLLVVCADRIADGTLCRNPGYGRFEAVCDFFAFTTLDVEFVKKSRLIERKSGF